MILSISLPQVASLGLSRIDNLVLNGAVRPETQADRAALFNSTLVRLRRRLRTLDRLWRLDLFSWRMDPDQTGYLAQPGRKDGGFNTRINGHLAVHAHDVHYREGRTCLADQGVGRFGRQEGGSRGYG